MSSIGTDLLAIELVVVTEATSFTDAVVAMVVRVAKLCLTSLNDDGGGWGSVGVSCK